jgi:hypothetical protein
MKRAELRRITLPRTLVNKGMKMGRSGRLRNARNPDASKEKGHKVGAAS